MSTEAMMRRPVQIRRQALLGSAASVGFALLLAYLTFVALGRQGRLGFSGFNLAGIVEGLVFIAAFVIALAWVRQALRVPSPTLLSFGLLAPPTAARTASRVPVIDSTEGLFSLADHRVVIVETNGVPVGMSGLSSDRITSWDELVKVSGEVAVTELRRLLAHEQLVVVMEGEKTLGVVTQEAYLSGLWGSVR